jgi:hypothetical protein
MPRLDLLNSPRSLCLYRCADRLFNQDPVAHPFYVRVACFRRICRAALAARPDLLSPTS